MQHLKHISALVCFELSAWGSPSRESGLAANGGDSGCGFPTPLRQAVRRRTRGKKLEVEEEMDVGGGKEKKDGEGKKDGKEENDGEEDGEDGPDKRTGFHLPLMPKPKKRPLPRPAPTWSSVPIGSGKGHVPVIHTINQKHFLKERAGPTGPKGGKGFKKW